METKRLINKSIKDKAIKAVIGNIYNIFQKENLTDKDIKKIEEKILAVVNKRISLAFGVRYDKSIKELKPIKKVICSYYGVDENHLDFNTNHRSVTSKRDIAWSFARKKTKLSYNLIGKGIGGRDHASVMAGVKRVDNLSKNPGEDELREDLINIENLLNGN
jgi:chromosomal replication initiation ATPase DnaA